MRGLRLIAFAALTTLIALAIVQCSDSTTPSDTLDLCEVDGDCPSGQFCESGVCTAGTSPCTTSDDCPAGQICRNGTCTDSSGQDGGLDGGDGSDGGDGADGADGGDQAQGPRIAIVTPPGNGSPPSYQLNFGNVAVGVAAEQQVVLENVGDADLLILQLNFGLDAGSADFSVPADTLDALPLTVGPGEQLAIDVIYLAEDGLTDHGVLDIISNDTTDPSVRIELLSEFKGQALVSAEPASLAFGDIPVGEQSGALHVTVSNQGTGNAVLTVTDIRFAIQQNPDFSLTVSDVNGQPVVLPALLNNGDLLDVAVTYQPQAREEDSDDLVVVSDDVLNPSASVALSGRGVVGDVTADPSPVTLGLVRVNGSAAQDVTLKNAGGAPLTVSGIQLAGVSSEWSLDSAEVVLADLADNPLAMNPGDELVVSVTFAPADIGPEAGQLLVDHSGPDGQLQVELSAEGYIPAAVELDPAPPDLVFGNVQYDAVAPNETAAMQVQIGNVGGAPLSIDGIQRDGMTLEFSWNPQTIADIAPGEQAVLNVTFTPAGPGQRAERLLVDTNDPDIAYGGVTGRFAINMVATGVDPNMLVLPAGEHDFGSVEIGQQQSVDVTVVSTTTDPLLIQGIGLTGGSSGDFSLVGLPALPSSLAGSQFTFQVVYTPSGQGDDVGELEVLSDDIGNPRATLHLVGTSPGCPDGLANCDADPSDCETDITSDLANCGSCDNACAADHGQVACQDRACVITACTDPWQDCDLEYDTGCEANTDMSLDHCQTCDNACAYDQAEALCTAGGCEMGDCQTDHWDLNGDPADGCEYDCTFISANDAPDGAFTDANCDGIDGEVQNAVFVAPGGSDTSNTCAMDDPCQTIARGLQVAINRNATQILLQKGTYAEVLVLSSAHDGIGIHGGYDVNWHRGDHQAAAYRTVVSGSYHSGSGQYLTVLASGAQVSFSNLILVGPSVAGVASGQGPSSYVVHASASSDLRFDQVTFTQGNGRDGQDGNDGSSASSVRAASGSDGGSSGSSNATCRDGPGGAGGAGASNASCASGTGGGTGGAGGRMDTCCDCVFGVCVCLTCNCDATGGYAGAAGASGGGAGGSAGAACNEGGNATAGADGVNGLAGNGGSGGQLISGLWWSARNGFGGVVGNHGKGGGGAGGGGGCDNGDLNPDTSGSGGGGGGAGGCRAPAAGTLGYGGGGSFGIFAIDSSITTRSCTFNRGVAGGGGDGGNGGSGQPGGLGGASGGGPGYAGGSGGAGGRGGHSGGGGGGAGGYSVGIYSHNSTVDEQSSTFSGGAAGSAGAGGSSPGNAGQAGSAGLLRDVDTF